MKDTKYYAVVRRKLWERYGKEDRSEWRKGVNLYAHELLLKVFNKVIEYGHEIPGTKEELEKMALNGAKNWKEYSYGGCALIYDSDIASRLCTPSELKKKRYGDCSPNRDENWLDVQTRALRQAFEILNIVFWIENE